MPHILIQGCNMNRIIQTININVDVMFAGDLLRNHPNRVQLKMDELQEALGEVVSKYFSDYKSDQVSNHEYNTRMR
jgi:hypothetical protein